MADFVKPAHERLAELEEIMQGWIYRKRAAQSDGTHPERVNREIANIQTYIERCNKQINELTNRRDNWRDLIEEADTHIARLRLEIDGLRGHAKTVITKSPDEQLLEIAKIATKLGLSQEDLIAAMAAAKNGGSDAVQNTAIPE